MQNENQDLEEEIKELKKDSRTKPSDFKAIVYENLFKKRDM